jgi:alpha-L-fucosidase 2
MASLYARAYKADSAARQLRIFASNFCSPNSFHLNGDQRGGQYSDFTYRPFTLEGNFAFAQGVHELLLQSRTGYIEVFPAVPADWRDVSFSNLRAEGAFLVSAGKRDGKFADVTICAEKGGRLLVKLPFNRFRLAGGNKKFVVKDGIVEMNMSKGEVVVIRPD